MTLHQPLSPQALGREARRISPAAGPLSVRSGVTGLPAQPPAHDARNLTQGGNLAQIGLDGQIYTLRITRQGKLILTK